MNRILLTNGMRKYMLLAAMLLTGTLTAGAQSYYVIHANGNYLEHTDASTLGNANSFDPATCLWTISGSKIVAISLDGTTGNQISHEGNYYYGYTLGMAASGDNWSNASAGSNPYITLQSDWRGNTSNYYIRYNNGWTLSTTNSNRGTITEVTRNTSINNFAGAYTGATITSGADNIYTIGNNTYTAQGLYVAAYSTTTISFTCANPSINSSTTVGDVPAAVPTNLDGNWTKSWSVSPTTYGTINASTGVLTITSLPASVDYITVTFTATKDAQTFTATKTVMLAKDAATVEGVVGNPTGVSSTTVTLNDYEPHSWSYYSDPDCPIRSLSPANVKITYYGNGIVMSNNNNYTAGTSNYVSPGNANYVGGAKVNVGGEDENTFVYYKTLERGDATQTAWTFSSGNQSSAASRCPYTTIPNPFQVRPTYGGTTTTNTADWAGWRGFQCWRLKSVSGGKVFAGASGGDALAVGAIINAETEYYFAPDAEYGMDVQLEAVWAIAYVVKAGNGATEILDHSSVGYERNFVVLNTTNANYNFGAGNSTGNTKRITSINRQATITRYLPNGVRGQNDDATCIRGAAAAQNNNSYHLTLEANTKFENVEFASMTAKNLTAEGHDLIIGRGCSGTINYVRGVSGNTTAPNYTLRIESGTINYLSLLKGYWTGSNNYTDNGSTMSGNVDLRCVLGCDYDRASNDGVTNNLIINNNVILGAQNTIADANKHRKTTNLIVKSGKIGNSININSNNSYMADAYQSIYMSVSNSQQTIGQRKVLVEGGEIIGIAGGIDAHYLGTGVTDNNVTGIPTPHTEEPSFSVRMIGGKVRGCIYGGAAKSPASGNRRMVFTGGTINGWIGCGCNGTEDDGGKTYGESFLYFGGETRCEADPSHDFTMNGTKGGYVFGAGKGFAGGTGTSGEMTYGTNVAIADNSYVQRDVFGGGNYGYALESTNVYVCGGTVHGNAFGGSNLKNGPVVNVKMIGGLIEGGLYGGSNETGNISGNVTVQIDGGQVGTPSQNANVHGGGLGNATRTLNNVYVNIGSRTDCNVSGTAVIYGDVYGGSAEGKTNGNTARQNNSVTNVTLNKGTIYGSLYGGGLGSASYAADVYGPVAVKVYGGTLTGGVYGANNVKGAPQNSVTVDIYGTDPQPGEGFAIANVYGGGNQAAYNNDTYPTVTVHNCNNSIGNVYGGGNAAAVTNTDVTIYGGNRIGAVYAGGNGTGVDNTFQMVTGNAVANIYGGTIDRVFAGNNSSGIVYGDKTVTINAGIDETTNAANCITCVNSPMKIGAVFHGGNQAAGSAGTVNIVCTGTYPNEYIDTLFGGANNADIVDNDMSTAEDVTLNIDRGYIRTGIFGGNNSGGAVTGDITINLTRNSGGTCAFDYPSVFGGGFGAGTSTGGDITINIGQKDATTTAPTINGTIAGGAVYGGSALGSVNAGSSDTTLINIYNGTIAGNIYGGGLGEADNATKGMVNGAVTVNIGASDQTDGNCASDLTACSVYGCNNTGGSPQGDVTVNVYRTGHTATNVRTYTAADATYAIDQVFGGGNKADYTPADDNKATVHVFGCDNTIRRVFGGGNAAAAKGVVTTIDGGRFDYVFGGGNGEVTAANIGAGGTNLTVNAGLIHYLFGGSNTSGTISGPMRTTVNNLPDCDEQIDNFFGGGNLADLGDAEHHISLTTTINCGTIFGDIYGGCNLANIYGDVTLTINGGTINNVYAGSKGVAAGDATYPAGKAADINGNVQLNIHAGDIGQAFGGSNINGNITGTIGVKLDWTQSDCSEKQIDYIYGASNDASYTPTAAAATGENFSPVVTLLHGTVDENVYGGGKGSTATVTAKPKVIAGDPLKSNNKKVSVMGDIFGGGNAAPVVGSTNVIVGHNSNVGRNVFGGGNAAPVSVDTEVEIKDKARISGNIYGGGNQGEIGGNTKVIVNGD